MRAPRAWRTAATCAALGLAPLAAGCAPTPEGLSPATSGAAAPAQEQAARDAAASPPEAGQAGATAAASPAEQRRVRPSGRRQLGHASYYGPEFTGRRMANGRRFDPGSTSVAHKTLPFGTTVLVTNLENGRSAVATVEDRGPFIRGRIIDLSPRLAAHLGMLRQGVAPVEVMPVQLAEAAD